MVPLGDPDYNTKLMDEMRECITRQQRVIEALELTISYLLQEEKNDPARATGVAQESDVQT